MNDITPIEQDERAGDASAAAPASKSAAKRSSFGMDAIGIAVSRFFLRFAGFISNLIIARLLGAEGRGLISALSTPSQIAVTVSELGIRQSAAFHIGRGLIPTAKLAPTLFGMIPMASALGIGVSLIYFEVADVAEGDWLLRALAVALIPLSLTSAYCTGVFLGEQRVAEFRKTNWRPAFVSLLLLVVLAWAGGLGIYGAMIAPVGGALIGAGYALYLVKRTAPLRIGFDRSIARRLQVKGLSYAASFIVLMLNYRVMILLLTAFSTLSEVGLYAQAILIAELIWEIPKTFAAIVLSRGVNAKDERLFSGKVQVLARISFLVAVLVSIGTAVVSPFFFPLAFGREFAGSAIVCNALLPGVAAFTVFKILNSDMAGRGRPWLSMTVMGPIFLLNIGLGWWAIERADALGAAIVSSGCYLLATAAFIVMYSRVTEFPVGEIVRYRRSDFDMLFRALPLGKLGLRRK